MESQGDGSETTARTDKETAGPHPVPTAGQCVHTAVCRARRGSRLADVPGRADDACVVQAASMGQRVSGRPQQLGAP